DFMAEDYESALKVMGNKHDLTGIRVYDRGETEMPNLGMVNMRDAETGEFMLVNTGSAAVRQNYATYYRRRVQYYEQAFTKSQGGRMSLQVGESYVKKLLGYFKRR